METHTMLLFHGALNDFLSKHEQGNWLTLAVKGTPSIKDLVEAQGVPHPEIGALLVNGQNAGFHDLLLVQAKIEVFPVVPEISALAFPPLQLPSPVPARFIVDVHAGKLARYLRLFGFDTLYDNQFDDKRIAHLANSEQRVILTRDVGLLKQKNVQWGYWLRSQFLETQLQEVFKRFGLLDQVLPFSRCMVCNGLLQPVTKEAVLPKLPPKTIQYFQTFYQCEHCQRVYWKGSHYDRMQHFLARYFPLVKN